MTTQGYIERCDKCGARQDFEGWQHEPWCIHTTVFQPSRDGFASSPSVGGYCLECSKEAGHPVYHDE